MKKLFEFKTWLTLDAAAQYLSSILGDSVNSADVLQLGLDGYLKLSVNFLNEVPVKKARLVSREQVVLANTSQIELKLKANQILTIKEDEIILIEGVWNLPMIDGERYLVKQKCHALSTKSNQNEMPTGQLLIEGEDGQLFMLFVRLADPCFVETCDTDDLESVTKKIAEQAYVPAIGLPEFADLVIRRNSLDAFVANPSNPDRELIERERDTLLLIIALLAKEANIPVSKSTKAAGIIADLSNCTEISISKTTIVNKLEMIRGAVERRTPANTAPNKAPLANWLFKKPTG
ncbi:hypothetical protein [Methylotenera versatilis]|uniref:Uncharacterized protein n=1 Tax=Methylotenera versatilis (strain 301) TaxID=666681 RepID=D7DJE2_METV0|nr:hypothetical protein [Methylotenera versatilis]ADI30177.1 hypothetical protein M301_1800 [Methylotenera versatilis 301]